MKPQYPFVLHVIAYLLPLLALPLAAWAASLEAIQAAAGSVNSVQAEFVQKKHLPILEKPLTSTGLFYFQAPRSLRWEYRSPIRSILLLHDGRVKRFVAEASGFREENGAGMQAMQVVMEEIGQWLKGGFDKSLMFAAASASDLKIILTPREAAMAEIIQRIELNLSPEPGVIYSVLIYESADSFTELIFSRTILNRAIAADLFNKTP
ncbi:MAG: outer membrane lipoprotein carrier protein LolA [Desulfobacterales bacterium]|jgi:hypothetical protein|nr:outer membrane lipoprotein carrier protein LolA [Desulfobacterales bacterium]